MVLIENGWEPNTCKCVLKYNIELDDPQPRPRYNIQIMVNCPEHSGITDPTIFYNTMLSENQRWNKIIGRLKDQFPQLFDNIDGVMTLKIGLVGISWTGSDTTRVLVLDLSATTLTTNQKTAVQTWADTNIGVGKVLVVG